MDLHWGPGLRRPRRRGLPRAARELDLHRGPPSTPPTGGEPGDAARIAVHVPGRHRSFNRRRGPPTAWYLANRPQTGRCDAKRRPDPPIPRRGAIRGRHRVVTHPRTTAGRDDLTRLLRNIWSATIRSLPAEDASRNRPNMIRIPMSVPAERTLERIVKYILCVSFVTLSLLSQMGSITILFSSPNYRESEGGKPPLHTNMQFFHP